MPPSTAVQAVFVSLAVTLTSLLFGGPSLGLGALTGAIVWAGAIAPPYLSNKLFAGHGFKVWAIEVGNHLLNFVAFGALFGLWR